LKKHNVSHLIDRARRILEGGDDDSDVDEEEEEDAAAATAAVVVAAAAAGEGAAAVAGGSGGPGGAAVPVSQLETAGLSLMQGLPDDRQRVLAAGCVRLCRPRAEHGRGC
jgi:hypothetical protein